MTETKPTAVLDRARPWVRPAGLVVSLFAGLGYFASVTGEHYPIKQWLFWPYLTYWLLTALFTFACGSAGDAVVRRVWPHLPASERLVGGLASGLLVFTSGMFAGGVLGLYGPAFFIGWPLLLLAAFGRPFFRFLRRYVRHRLAAGRRAPPSVLASTIFVIGLLGVGMVYFPILTPDNIAGDSHWYHVAIAEHYAIERGIHPFVEGWYQGTLPQLATLVYTWAFLLPGGGLFDHVELAAHLEFAIFLWTLFGIPVLVRWAIARARSRTGGRIRSSGSWAALFLFPGIFLYDSSVTANADHVAAFWAVPIFLGLGRAFRAPSVRSGAWFAIPVAGAMLTKYQAVTLAAFPVAALVGRTAWLLVRPRTATARRDALLCLLSCAGTGLVLTASHWLKNWVFYGDPLYPHLHAQLRVHPWTVDSGHLFDRFYKVTQVWAPTGTTSEKLTETAKALLTFSFVPNDWPGFHGSVPVFGSLFTLSVLPLVFLRKSARLWAIVLSAHVGVFLWYWISHQDRYLQALVPWMATVVAGTLCLAWESGALSRAAVTILVGFQIVWGGDVFFIPTHAIIGTVPAKHVIDFLSSGYRKNLESRKNVFGFWRVANALPPKAKVLIHDMHDHLGIERATVSDIVMWQGGLSYGRLPSPRAFDDRMRQYGITDFLWRPNLSTAYDSLAGDFLFFGFVSRFAGQPRRAGDYLLATVPETPPPDVPWLEWPATILVCSDPYEPGLYHVSDLRVPTVGPRSFPAPRQAIARDADPRKLVAESQFVAFEPKCGFNLPMSREPAFRQMAVRYGAELWVRVDAVPEASSSR